MIQGFAHRMTVARLSKADIAVSGAVVLVVAAPVVVAATVVVLVAFALGISGLVAGSFHYTEHQHH